MSGLNLSSIPADPTVSEDCPFLDVVVLQSVFGNNTITNAKTSGAPVVIWSYGGGFVLGNRNTNPAGLVLNSQQGGREPIVYVAISYRLGMFVSFLFANLIELC